jgi:hypothetical protein
MRHPARTLVAALVVTAPGASLAQTGDPAAAAELFRQGREAMGRGDLATACPKFSESQRLDAKVGTLINLAQCEEQLGKLASAQRHWAAAQALAHAQGDAREAYVTQQIDAIASRVPHVVVRLAPGAPADTGVSLDGVSVAPGDLGSPLAADAGAHVVVAAAAGRGEHRFDVRTTDGATAEVTVEPGDVLPPRPPPPPASALATGGAPTTQTGEQPGGTGAQRWIAYGLGGLGVVAAGLGTVWGIQAVNAKGEPGCQNGVCGTDAEAQVQRDGRAAGDRATVSFIAAGVLLASGVTLWLTAPRTSSQARGPSVETRVGIGTIGVRGTW